MNPWWILFVGIGWLAIALVSFIVIVTIIATIVTAVQQTKRKRPRRQQAHTTEIISSRKQ